MHVAKLICLLNFNDHICQNNYHIHGYLTDVSESQYLLSQPVIQYPWDTKHIFYFLVPEILFEEFPTFRVLVRVRACLPVWKLERPDTCFLSLPSTCPAGRTQVQGLGSAYLKQVLAMQKSWYSPKSFLVAKSITWSSPSAQLQRCRQWEPWRCTGQQKQ